MKPICTTIAMALAVVAFLAAQDAATKGKAKAKGEGALVILQQAPQDKTVSIPLETLKKYYAASPTLRRRWFIPTRPTCGS